MSTEQERVLELIEDPQAAKVLSDLWNQIDGEPLAAARMVRAFQSARQIINETLKDLPEKWEQLEQELTKADIHRARFTQDLRDFRAGTMSEVKAAVDDLKLLQDFFLKVDDDKFLNRANRLIEICEKLARLKKDGTLEMLKQIL